MAVGPSGALAPVPGAVSTDLSLSVVHTLQRRVRLRVPSIRRDPEKAYILEILLRKKDGIKKVEASPRTTGVCICFDPEELPLRALIPFVDALIKRLPAKRLPPARRRKKKGEPRKPGAAVKETVCAVEGLTCQSCALLIELVLERAGNVDRASVNFASGTVAVAGPASPQEVFDIIRRTGYTPRPMDTLSQRLLMIERDKQRLRRAKRRLIISSVLAAPVVVAGMSMSHALAPRTLSFLLTTPLVFGAGRPFFERAFLLARQGAVSMDTLIALGSGAAYVHSTASFLAGRRHLYFESAAGIITLILMGRYLEEKARGKAGQAIRKLMELQPLAANVIRDGEEIRVGIDDVAAGDEVIVRPGDRVPVDGEAISGNTTMDESLVTGESLPVAKGPGDQVTGGTINVGGAMRFRATAVGGDTVLAGIIRMVDHAQSSKVPVQRMVDRISSFFVPAVIGIAGLTFLAWWALAGRRFYSAMMKSVSVLLISCPCSLGLATPTAIMTGAGAAARQGIYIRDAEGLEKAGRIDVLVLDKTGTLTEGRPAVTDFVDISGMKGGKLLQLLASAEYNSEHFIGGAIRDFAAARGVDVLAVEEFEAVAGRGVMALVGGQRVAAGNEAIFEELKTPLGDFREMAEQMGREGKTPVFVAVDGRRAGVMGVADRPRATAAAAIRKLRSMGIETIMVTGDNQWAAGHIAGLVGIDKVIARATPARKLEFIRSLREEGRTVGMIGDGVNDAPALAEADVGFAVGTGTDIAMETSHITLVGGDISKAAEAIVLSRKTMAIIRENLFWAFAYNTLAIPLAASGKLTPTIASGSMAMSSVSVVANSLRLQRQGFAERSR